MPRSLPAIGIVGGLRIPFCRVNTGYADVGNLGMSIKVLGALVERYGLHRQELGDVVFGAVMKHPQDWNLAREAALASGLAQTTPGYTVARACGTSLDAAITAVDRIHAGQYDVAIAGGSDSTSDVPLALGARLRKRLLQLSRARSTGEKLKALRGISLGELKPAYPGVAEPRTLKSMGEHCELMARHWHISREEQDAYALDSHRKAAAAYQRGFFNDLVVPFRGVDRDNVLRADTSLEKLAQLKPAFDKTSGHGTLTAGNSSALSDGAAAVLVASETWAGEHGMSLQARLTHARVAAVDFVHGEGLLMAPTVAVARLLKAASLSLQDFDFYEIHEAFAAQVLCTLRAWESDQYCRDRLGLDKALGPIDPAKLNVNGSSLALGHPFAATGARLLATMGKLLQERGGGRGLVSICTAGGMGVTAILER
ncbi:MAG TPA: acetyl-CoA C-acetyltransferase [Rhodanobacteraceae bacterium]|nr:acetyl-CoA C-acetyltransferase [Rhodanobacteraceae bacterium]